MRMPEQTIGSTYTESVSWELLNRLVDCAPRMAGHEGEQAAIETMAEQFRDLGLEDVTVEEFEVPTWYRGRSELRIPSTGRTYTGSHELIGLPLTPPGEVAGPVVDVGYGTPEEYDKNDVEGALVVASGGTPDSYDRWLHRREKYEMAADRGAVGFLFRSRRDGCLPPTGGIGGDSPPGEIPGVGISRELADKLTRRSIDEAELTVECETERSPSANVSARLGPDTDDELLLTAHHDAHDIAEGANDNGCGCALVVEVARILKTVEDDLETAVRATTFGAEEIGLLGSTHAAEQLDHDDIKAVFNLDGIGTTRDLAVDTHGFEAIAEAAERVDERGSTPIDVNEKVNTHSDHWPFAREGVPAAMAYSVGGSDRRGWGHTHADTLDKLDARDLRSIALPLAEMVLELADEDCSPEHVSSETVLERAREEGYDV
ncbi:M28 family peptidase [Halovenus halobia]|uniref:M28 family peptidase n=1 Tax=Halovenus halobia TaxID=3396622 RepID=UPI003F5672F0